MRYIVDGYNVINSSDKFSASSSSKEGRRRLIEFIQSYRPHGSFRNSATVVFDSKSENQHESTSHNRSCVGNIEIIFSSGVLSADDIITRLVDESKNSREIMIVTNDKGLCRRTSLRGAKHETVKEFLIKGFRKENMKVEKTYFNNEEDIITREFERLWLKR